MLHHEREPSRDDHGGRVLGRQLPEQIAFRPSSQTEVPDARSMADAYSVPRDFRCDEMNRNGEF